MDLLSISKRNRCFFCFPYALQDTLPCGESNPGRGGESAESQPLDHTGSENKISLIDLIDPSFHLLEKTTFLHYDGLLLATVSLNAISKCSLYRLGGFLKSQAISGASCIWHIKKIGYSLAGNRTPAAAVKTPNPSHQTTRDSDLCAWQIEVIAHVIKTCLARFLTCMKTTDVCYKPSMFQKWVC